MFLVGQISAIRFVLRNVKLTCRAILATIAQILGGMTAAAMADALLPGKLLAATTLGGIYHLEPI